MLLRYRALSIHLDNFDIPAIKPLLPNTSDENAIDELCYRLKDLESITKELQFNRTTLADVRARFDTVIAEYRSTSKYFDSSASIVRHKDFESVFAKKQAGKVQQLTQSESASISQLTPEPTNTENENLAQRALKKQNIERTECSFYIDTLILLPTSNICERLFSLE